MSNATTEALKIVRLETQMQTVETKIDRLDMKVDTKIDQLNDKFDKFIENIDDRNDKRYAPRWIGTVVLAVGMTIVLAFIGALVVLVFRPGLGGQSGQATCVSTCSSSSTATPAASAPASAPASGAPSARATSTASATPSNPQASQTSNGGASVSVPLPSL